MAYEDVQAPWQPTSEDMLRIASATDGSGVNLLGPRSLMRPASKGFIQLAQAAPAMSPQPTFSANPIVPRTDVVGPMPWQPGQQVPLPSSLDESLRDVLKNRGYAERYPGEINDIVGNPGLRNDLTNPGGGQKPVSSAFWSNALREAEHRMIPRTNEKGPWNTTPSADERIARAEGMNDIAKEMERRRLNPGFTGGMPEQSPLKGPEPINPVTGTPMISWNDFDARMGSLKEREAKKLEGQVVPGNPATFVPPAAGGAAGASTVPAQAGANGMPPIVGHTGMIGSADPATNQLMSNLLGVGGIQQGMGNFYQANAPRDAATQMLMLHGNQPSIWRDWSPAEQLTEQVKRSNMQAVPAALAMAQEAGLNQRANMQFGPMAHENEIRKMQMAAGMEEFGRSGSMPKANEAMSAVGKVGRASAQAGRPGFVPTAIENEFLPKKRQEIADLATNLKGDNNKLIPLDLPDILANVTNNADTDKAITEIVDNMLKKDSPEILKRKFEELAASKSMGAGGGFSALGLGLTSPRASQITMPWGTRKFPWYGMPSSSIAFPYARPQARVVEAEQLGTLKKLANELNSRLQSK